MRLDDPATWGLTPTLANFTWTGYRTETRTLDIDRRSKGAEIMNLDDLLAKDRELDFECFDHSTAWELGQRLVGIANQRSLPITTAIWLGDQLVFQAALPGTSADNDKWMARKAAVVRRYDASSWLTKHKLKANGFNEASAILGLDPQQYALVGGAVPIRVRGTSVGVAVVSGLTDQEDHELIVSCIRSLAIA